MKTIIANSFTGSPMVPTNAGQAVIRYNQNFAIFRKNMKTLNLSFILLISFGLFGCATGKQADTGYASDTGRVAISSDDSADVPVKLLRITANVDGSERIRFTGQEVKYEHKFWSRPTHVTVDGKPWVNLNHTPSGWHQFSKGLDLPRAWIVKREGRDLIALEPTPAGFDLYLCDSPNGSAEYEVTIAIPRKH